jgi:hypothetical protein
MSVSLVHVEIRQPLPSVPGKDLLRQAERKGFSIAVIGVE